MTDERLGEKLYRNINLPKPIREAIKTTNETDEIFEVKSFFARLKNDITTVILSGNNAIVNLRDKNGYNTRKILNFPTNDIRMERSEENANIFMRKIIGNNEGRALIVRDFIKWLHEQGLRCEAQHADDGVGIESWISLYFSPTPELIAELNDSKPRFSYKRK